MTGGERLTQGWRTLVVESAADLRLEDDCLIADGDASRAIPVPQLKTLMIASNRGSISLPLLDALCRNHVNVLFCGDRHEPLARITPLCCHEDVAGRIMDQSRWPAEARNELWRQIVTDKIERQCELLRSMGLEVPERMATLAADVLPGDRTNREGQAARLYFPALFGSGFRRGADDPVNSALNYGYTIVCSAMSRIVSAHGYHPALGVHHCSRNNPVNLPCDLMEPFRPVVDELVYRNGERELDWAYKKELIALLHCEVRANGVREDLQTAMEAYALRILRALNSRVPSGGESA